MAGEIYVADKATLDSVKSTVDGISTSLKNTLSVTELLNKYVVTFKSVSASATVVNVSTPGTLYYVLGHLQMLG